ncbi:MAG: stage II sporulation protein P [Firmicutes bacterium]|nr:stage II sporulation protein P [Bacillota bacterium]
MSYRYRYSYRRRSRSRYSATVIDFRKKELKVFLALFLVLVIAMSLLSPYLPAFSPVLVKEALQNISLLNHLDLSLLLADSIPGGMGLKAENSSPRQTIESGDSKDGRVPLNSSPAGSGPEEDKRISFLPVELQSGSGNLEDLLLATQPEGVSLENAAVSLEGKGPLILIYHTHATESFMPFSGEAFSTDMEKTVVALGNYLTEILQEQYGIPVLHHCEVFDIPRRSAYEKARPSVEKILAENPGIEVVLDLHRDGVSRNITTTSIDGRQTGRVLFVLGSKHQGWNNNLRFALFLQDALEEVKPGLSRGIRKQPFVYNQNLHQRSLIVEIGGHENSMEEVKRTIPYLAEALASILQ